ncbi:MAG: hypothetical protein KGP28_11165 [Bdellovibrionales bacterium]|nr:hypothetical protein [Bdellovibrionales bacterium]
MAVLMMSTGCGMLGNKALPKSGGSAGVGDNGCLNNSKNLVGRFLDGSISQQEWKSAFDCVNQSLGFFTDYVRGTSTDAYTPGDMYNLVKGFLITNRNVNPELLIGAFSLKSALFGGSNREFTKGEIELLKKSLERLQSITGELIPYLGIRQKPNPTFTELLELTAAFKRAGEQLADFVNTLPVGMLSDGALKALIQELTYSLELPIIDELGDKVFLAKWLIFNTRRDAVENGDWPKIFRTSLGLGGIGIALKSAVSGAHGNISPDFASRIMNDPEFRDFLWELLLQAKPYVEESIAAHNGSTPLPLFDHVIDALPESFLNSLPKRSLKMALRPLLRKVLLSNTKTGVDQGVVDTVYQFIGDLILDLRALDQFYLKTGLDRNSVSPQFMAQRLEAYLSTLSETAEKTRFRSIRSRILTYRPQFRKRQGAAGEVHTIQFGQGVGYSHYQNFMVLALDRAARHILKAYAGNRDYLVDTEVTAFFKDFSDILFAMKIIDATVPNFGGKRLQDMDLFTDASDGNLQGSLVELVNYAMIIISSGELTDRMRAEITPVCDQGLGTDIMGWTLVPAQCLRSQFHERLEYWIGDDFPRLSAFWRTLSPEEKRKAMTWLEHGSRRNGFTEEEFGKFDIGALGVILYYTESLFNRFDFDTSEVLSKAEVNSAYPVFKELLRKTASEKGLNTGNDFLLRGIYTYIVRHQEMPATPASVANLAKLAWWMATYSLPTTNYSADRYGVFNIVCQIAKPENPNLAPPNAEVCKP